MIKFLLCDDNFETLNKLSNMLDAIIIKHNLEANIDYETTTDLGLLTYIKKHHIDVFILDINLHCNLNGIDLAKIIRQTNKNCYIIFVTHHREYIELAYKYKTFDFLNKPLSRSVLEETILRLFDDITGITTRKKYIKIDNKSTLIDENEVQYIMREGMKVIFRTKTENLETYSSFNKLQVDLPSNFVRCHKSFIVNINNITKLDASSNIVYFKDNLTCAIGPKYKKDFLKEVESL